MPTRIGRDHDFRSLRPPCPRSMTLDRKQREKVCSTKFSSRICRETRVRKGHRRLITTRVRFPLECLISRCVRAQRRGQPPGTQPPPHSILLSERSLLFQFSQFRDDGTARSSSHIGEANTPHHNRLRLRQDATTFLDEMKLWMGEGGGRGETWNLSSADDSGSKNVSHFSGQQKSLADV